MKFLITENKLEQIVFKYLDNKDFIKIETNDKIEFVYSKEDRIATILYTIDTEMLRIHNELIEEISSFFSIKENFTKVVIGNWVEKETSQKVVATIRWYW